MASSTTDIVDASNAIEEILTFWFGKLHSLADVDTSKSGLWWAGGEEADAEIARRFAHLVTAARAGELHPWCATARGCLALVILLDQFTRCLGRGTDEAFAGDAAALRVSLTAQERGHDRELRPVERAFLYMPMMHAEDSDIAHRSIETFGQLSQEIATLGRDGYPDFHPHAVSHANTVLRFGRYPHRNELLGRTSTRAEVDYLANGAPTYGQGKRQTP